MDDGAYTLEGTNRLTIRKEFPSVTVHLHPEGQDDPVYTADPEDVLDVPLCVEPLDGDPRHQLDSPLRLAAVSELRGADSACHA